MCHSSAEHFRVTLKVNKTDMMQPLRARSVTVSVFLQKKPHIIHCYQLGGPLEINLDPSVVPSG